MVSIFTGVTILICFIQAYIASPLQQEVLATANKSTTRVNVEGHNHAYYTQVKKEDQLLFIRDLAVYPDPPALNEHNFILLDGWIDEKYPGLEDATLKISAKCPDSGEFEKKLTDIGRPVVRRPTLDGTAHDYGGPLKQWRNEIFFDQFWLYYPDKEPFKGHCFLEATAKLPDKRILFSIAMDFTVQWPPPDT